MKKAFKGLVLTAALSTALAACSKDETDKMDGMDHENMNHENTDKNMGNSQGSTEVSNDLLAQFAAAPETMNENAAENVQVMNTKNTTRLDAQDPVRASVLVSQTIWPATHTESQPGTVILVPDDSWQITLAAADLIHHPNNGPILVTDKNELSTDTLNEIKRLNPKGNEEGTQVMIMGDLSEGVKSQLEGFQVEAIEETDPAQFAAAVDEKYASVSGDEYPESVIIVSADEAAKAFSIPAINWIAHMPEPVLYVTKGGIPEATKQALGQRENASLYLLGPDSVISKEIETELNEYGKVTRIAGEDPVSTSIEFAKFKDEETSFGWGLTEPGHGVSFVSSATPDLALAAAPFSHLGKHAPVLWLEEGKVTEPVYDFLATIKPTFEEDPTQGPYNHGFIVGGQDSISFETQGILDDKLEIVQADGEGHGSH
ncbi:cell wall-binding repeat-containing protein [Domibacillus sp. A3M-37]|uniref:cell wall-binding repeat-containing protein n=1 Tax=Domibacillus TaxID=1433999 RepID=UPI0020B7717F|nr:cell wall-binding repeat-containing protein [Domibacillus sp. A3M-37]MCP3763395.1 cell wall-binding repeat-containing protein [Domibacillus sp. A3M-37]